MMTPGWTKMLRAADPRAGSMRAIRGWSLAADVQLLCLVVSGRAQWLCCWRLGGLWQRVAIPRATAARLLQRHCERKVRGAAK